MTQLNKQQQEDFLKNIRKDEEERLIQILAERNGLPYVNLSATATNTDALRLIDEATSRRVGIVAFSLIGKKLFLAVTTPKRAEIRNIIDDLERQGYEPKLHMTSSVSMERAWKLYKEVSYATETEAGVFDVSKHEVENFMEEVTGIEDLKRLIDELNTKKMSHKISRTLEIILAGAIAVDASDIHIEPAKDSVPLRFRIDGVLHNLSQISPATHKLLLSRIKLLSGLKLNTRQSAQDGRFSINLGTTKVDIRTSILPGEYGEYIVMRILNPESININLEDMGIEGGLFDVILKQIKKPNGLILTTGPTGSGKTTTLYAFLNKIHNPEIKIITIENPIEYHLDGITQTQVNKAADYTFLNGLRSALRQDPDIIMVGEIRDEETARVAINSALTGHLVFSTLHTNNAAGVIPRLVDLGVNPKVISSAINLSLAQRLVRKLCVDCREEYVPEAEEKELVETLLRKVAEKREGINTSVSKLWRVPENNTCKTCGGIGYKGRIGVYEGILTDKKIEELIKSEDISETTILEASREQKLLTLAEDGIVKVINGITSFEELQRVVDIEE